MKKGPPTKTPILREPELLRGRFQTAVARLKEHARGTANTEGQRFRKKFSLARQRLRTRILDDFKRTDWPRFQKLNEIFQKGLGLPVPTLSVCGSGTAEVRYTRLLAYFFDTRNRHGLGGLLACAVFADEIDGGVALPFETCTAQAEVSLGVSSMSNGCEVENSLDLLIEVGRHKILVEQKIKSAEGKEQLRRYSAAIEQRFGAPSVTCFFLTPEGRSGREGGWLPLSYRDLFCRMASVLDRHALSGAARHNLQALLWDLMLGPLAQDRRWMDELQHQTELVARDFHRYADLRNWFSRYGMGHDELRVITQLVE